MIKTSHELSKYFKEQDFTIKFLGGKERKFTTINSLNTFLDEEISYWTEYNSSQSVKKHHETIYSESKQMIESLSKEDSIDNQLIIIDKLKQLLNSRQGKNIYSKSSIAIVLEEIDSYFENIDSNMPNYIFNYVLKKSFPTGPNIMNNNSQSILHKIDFIYFSTKLLDVINNNDQLTLSLNENILNDLENFKNKIDSQTEKIYSASDDYLIEQREKFSGLYDENTSRYDNYYIENKERYDNYYNATEKDFNDLKKKYTEFLRLKGPSEYWEKYAKGYGRSAIIWLILAVVIVAILVTSSIIAFMNFDKIFPQELNTRNAIRDTVKWILLFSLSLSVLIYMLRLFVRLTLSSFHLKRDASERLNLSHYYLSLIDKGQISDAEKKIIIESLFSRADTGLLKGDSSPSFPNSLIDGIINKS